MRPYGTSEQLARRRQRARDLRRRGLSPQQVAQRIGETLGVSDVGSRNPDGPNASAGHVDPDIPAA